MKKMTIDTFFKKRDTQNLEASRPTSIGPSNSNIKASIPEHCPSKAYIKAGPYQHIAFE